MSSAHNDRSHEAAVDELNSATDAPGFLRQLRSDGPWVLSAIIPDGKATTATLTDMEGVRAFIEKHNGQRNIYYSLNPTKTAVRTKAKKKDIAACEYLHVDIDAQDGETPEEAKARGLAALDSLEHKPTAVIDSGGGVQALWRLQVPVTIEEGEARNRALATRLLGDHSAWNADRILRLPGTVNLPTKKKREKGRVECEARPIRFNGAAYPVETFEAEAAEAERQPPVTRPVQVAARRGKDESPDVDEIIRSGDASRWKSRSEAVWFVACELLRRGESQDTVVGMLLDPANGISKHVREQSRPSEYAKRQVKKAAQEVVREAATNRPPVVSVTVTPGKGEDPSEWTFHFEGGKELTMTSKEVFRQASFLQRCFDALRRHFVPRTTAQYSKWINELAEAAAIEEAPASTGTDDQFLELLEEFVTNRTRGDQIEDVLSGRPWLDERKGRYCFQLKDFETFLHRERSDVFRAESRVRIAKRIRKLGGDVYITTVKGRSIRLFWVPAAAVQQMPTLPPPPRKGSPL